MLAAESLRDEARERLLAQMTDLDDTLGGVSILAQVLIFLAD